MDHTAKKRLSVRSGRSRRWLRAPGRSARWALLLAVGLLASGCFPPAPSQPNNQLTLVFIGNGTGTVTSMPDGINCTSTCSATFWDGAHVNLYAKADADSVLIGIGGDCPGYNICDFSLHGNMTATVTFLRAPVSYVNTWGSSGTAQGQFNSPRYVATDGGGNVYVTDTGNNRVQEFDSSGGFIRSWGSFGSAAGQFNMPLGIAVAGTTVYVADHGNGRVQRFSTTGTYLGEWGVVFPYALSVDSGGNVYVTSDGTCMVYKFGSTGGAPLLTFGVCGQTIGGFEYPRGLGVDSAGEIFVADDYGNRVQKFGSSGNYMSFWGGYGQSLTHFNYPRGVFVDYTDFVYVADSENSRIQVFDPSGDILGAWGSWGDGAYQFKQPNSLVVDPATDNVFVVDTGNNRIVKYAW